MDQSLLKIAISIQLRGQKTNVPPKIDVYANTLMRSHTHKYTQSQKELSTSKQLA